jgi:hypothetical protein
MDTSAFVATLTTSLAIGSTIVLVRLLRQDRQRSEARVAALVTLSARPAPLSVPAMTFDQPPVRLERRPRTAPVPAARTIAAPKAAPAPRGTALNVANIEIFRDTSPVEPAAASPELFEPAVPRARNNLFFIGAGALALAAVIALSFGGAFTSGQQPAEETTASVAGPATATAAPLALLALRHEQSADGTLVISGIVRNPAGSAPRQRLFAAASLVDAEGGLVATARAPLDFTILAPGEESPFVVRVSGANGVARYRIGFRDAEGASVAHLDRRQP